MITTTLTSLIALAALVSGGSAQPEDFDPADIAVSGSRPLATAIELLEARHGQVITYEDAPYGSPIDINDVTLTERRDLANYPPGQAPRVLIPRPGKIEAGYLVARGTGQPDDMAAVVQMLADVHAQNGNPGAFEVRGGDRAWHVVPRRVMAVDGELRDVVPLLDLPVTLADADRNGVQTLEALCAELARLSGHGVQVGTVPLNLLMHHHSRVSCENATARDVLAGFLTAVRARLSWQLFYDPGAQLFVLNVHGVEP